MKLNTADAPNCTAQVILLHMNHAYILVKGILHDDLKVLLETNVKSSKKDKVILGVSDSKLSASINEELGLSCQHTGVVPEIIRGMYTIFLANVCSCCI